MASMEKERQTKKESDKIRSRLLSCLCMEQNKKGRMGSGTKPDTYNNDNIGKIKEARLSIYARLLLQSMPAT